MSAAKRIGRRPILRVSVGALSLRSSGEEQVVTVTGCGIPKPLKTAKLAKNPDLALRALMKDMLTAESIGAVLNLSYHIINKMRREDRLVGLSAGKRQYRYPKEQIGRHGLLNGLQDVIRACRGDHWQAWDLLRSPANEIGFKSGFAALKKGAVRELLAVKEGRDHGTFS
jgi:hypothetical protein